MNRPRGEVQVKNHGPLVGWHDRIAVRIAVRVALQVAVSICPKPFPSFVITHAITDSGPGQLCPKSCPAFIRALQVAFAFTDGRPREHCPEPFAALLIAHPFPDANAHRVTDVDSARTAKRYADYCNGAHVRRVRGICRPRVPCASEAQDGIGWGVWTRASRVFAHVGRGV
jgi:hypothetical protein